MSIIGVGTRGTGGTCPPPPQPSRNGASAPTARAMPVHAVIGLTMKYHIEFQEQVATKSILIPDTVINAKRAWFIPKVGVVAKFSLTNTTMPPPPPPPTITIFLRLCQWNGVCTRGASHNLTTPPPSNLKSSFICMNP